MAPPSVIDRTKLTPQWINGGGTGLPNKATLAEPDGISRIVQKETASQLLRGSGLEISTGGGGGWGPRPIATPPRSVKNILDGYVSREQARALYGSTEEMPSPGEGAGSGAAGQAGR